MTTDMTRAEQMAMLLEATEKLRDQGWRRATVRVTRAGTVEVDAHAGEDTVARPAFGSGRRK
jgi:hypothetical protein